MTVSVRLRLQRMGLTHKPVYRIVAAYSKFPRDGRHLEILGMYRPIPEGKEDVEGKVKRIEMNMKRIRYWLAVGAQPSEIVAKLLGLAGMLPMPPPKDTNRLRPASHPTRPSIGLSVAPEIAAGKLESSSSIVRAAQANKAHSAASQQ
mmetsp:Transcript_12792/g.34419  ORF Transcript_12792/g.34419 Transcript_12792/m.34419 type:complete len:148 (+) Transcript_12792:57-500(+)